MGHCRKKDAHIHLPVLHKCSCLMTFSFICVYVLYFLDKDDVTEAPAQQQVKDNAVKKKSVYILFLTI